MTDRQYIEAAYANRPTPPQFRTVDGVEQVWMGSSMHNWEPVADYASRLRRARAAAQSGGDIAAALRG